MLSDHEQRLLEQMEQALYAEDPKFASSLRGSDLRNHYRRRAVKAVIGFILGVVLLMAGAVFKVPPVSIIGFVIMLAAALFGLSSWKRTPRGGELPTPSGPARQKAKPKSSMMERIEERWRRRREENGGR
ncbi:spore wall synthesis complex protein [soil metagenome]